MEPTTISFGKMRDQAFNVALRKLINYPFKNQKTAYRLLRIQRVLEQETKNAQELFLKLLKQFADLDKEGNFVPRLSPDGKPEKDTFVILEKNQAAFDTAADEFAALSFVTKWRPLELEDLEECRLSSAELHALDSLIAAPPEDLS